MNTARDNKILEYLEDFPPSHIYYLASKEIVQRGFRYYQNRHLIHFDWAGNYKSLISSVKSEKSDSFYDVIISINRDGLNYHCNCPSWNTSSNCKHVVCVLFTVKNIFSPDLFKVNHNEEHRKKLISELTYREEKDQSDHNETAIIQRPEYSILITKIKFTNNFLYIVQKDGIKVKKYTRNTPMEMRELIDWQDNFYYLHTYQEKFIDYLKKIQNLYPIIVRIGDKDFQVSFDPLTDYICKTELNAFEDRIEIKKLCFSNDNQIYNNLYQFGDKLAVDIEKEKLLLIKEKRGWEAWEFYKDIMDRNNTYNDSLNDFNKFNDPDNYLYDDLFEDEESVDDVTIDELVLIPIGIFQKSSISYRSEFRDKILKQMVIKINNEISTPKEVDQRYSLTIDESKEKEGFLTLKAESIFGKLKISTEHGLFSFFTDIRADRSRASLLKTKKRRLIIFEIMVKLLSVRTNSSAEKLIKESLKENDNVFDKYRTKSEAKSLLNEYFSTLRSIPEGLQYSGGDWVYLTRDREKEGLLYSIPCEIFGPEIFNEMTRHNEMNILASDLYEKLTDLYHRLKEYGIDLYFNGKSVVTSNWDFSIDVNRGSNIDWFEIKPEIRCNGDLIDDVELQQVIAGKGMIEKDNCIKILDPNSQKILNSIATLISTGSGSERKKKEIVRVPRLQILDWIYLRSKGVKVRLSPEDEMLIEKLISFEKIEDKKIPVSLKAELRPYQITGYNWLSFLYEYRFGACLADDMGLGKTIQAITLLGGIKEKIVIPAKKEISSPHLIVLPPSLLFNWQNEIDKFYPNLRVHLYTGQDRSTVFKDCDVVLTTYGIVRKDIEYLKEIDFHVVIFDEAQAVKNIYANTTGTVRQLNGYFKISMTGTPIENHIGEYYSILDLSIPGLLGEYDKFKSEIKHEKSALLDIVIKRTKPFVLRRTKEEILKDLPPKTETNIYLDLNHKQKTLYQKTVEMVRSTIDEAYSSKTKAQASIIALTALLKLRQICVSPSLISHDIDEASPKIEFLINKLKELLDEGHSALVFSQFTSFLDILERDLKENEIAFCRLDGSTAVPKRKKLVEDFQNGKDASIFLLSLKAGGQGLNLTKASYVFHLDPWWNPAVENQASDRAHRIGQQNKVTVMRILMRHTIEEKMMALKEKKLALYKAVMSDSIDGKKGFSVTRSDFDFLLDS